VDGVYHKNLSNPIPNYAPHPEDCTDVQVGIETKMTNPNPDPGEDYAHVNVQLFGQVIPEDNRFPEHDEKPEQPYNLPKRDSYTDAPMNGFVLDYINHYQASRNRMPEYDEYKVIMNCHEESSLPVLSTLAKEYAVFDRWFASVPSQTLCNRSFLHAATSFGYVLNSPVYRWLIHDAPTIYNRIQDKQDASLTWKIYYDKFDVVSFTGLLYRKLWPYRSTHFFQMDDFERDARRGELPSYSFIEPRFFVDHNDQHPPVGVKLETSNALAGELLIHRVYDAVRNGKHWEKTLLIITYDEHGGCYDHVSPPAAVSPDSASFNGELGFKFDRLGVRVPMVMVSPYIPKGTVVSDTHDHTSIIKAACDRWDLEPLTERDRQANSFDKILSLQRPRSKRETPAITPRKYKIPRQTLDEPINPLQKTIMFVMAGFEDAIEIYKREGHTTLQEVEDKLEDLYQAVIDDRRIAHITTVGQAIHFAIGFDRRVTKHLPFWDWFWLKIILWLRRLLYI
jgi:phospholipase C